MLMIVEPKPEFHSLDEAAVLAALEDPNEENPIAKEIARLIAGYTENFRTHVERLGRIPESIMHVKPRWAIEAVAMRLMTETLRYTVARKKAD